MPRRQLSQRLTRVVPPVVDQDIAQAKAAPAVGGGAEPAGVTSSVLSLQLEPSVPRLTHEIDERRHGVAGGRSNNAAAPERRGKTSSQQLGSDRDA